MTSSVIPPRQVGDLVRQANAQPTVSRKDGKETSTATYQRDGRSAVLVLMSRPHDSVHDFLTDNAIDGRTQLKGATCGVSADAGSEACAAVVEQTAILVVDLDQHTTDELAGIVGELATTIKNR